MLGVGISVVDLERATDTVAAWLAEGRSAYVCVRDVHGVMQCQDHPDLLEIHRRAGMVVPDGMPVVWLLRLDGRVGVDRVYGPDLMSQVIERSTTTGWRHYLYGSTPETLALLEANLSARFPGCSIVGTESPPFREPTAEEEWETVQCIEASGADIVWVGLSTPKQERWMAANAPKLAGKVLIGVGAAFDFHAGTKRQAPRFIQRSGFEWLFRLVTEPRRLAGRYLRNNPRFVYLLARDLLRGDRPAVSPDPAAPRRIAVPKDRAPVER